MNKLSHRSYYYIACILMPIVATIIEIVLLRPSNFGADLPEFVRIGGPILLGIVSSAFFLTHAQKDLPAASKSV
jgi:hypothetical protein